MKGRIIMKKAVLVLLVLMCLVSCAIAERAPVFAFEEPSYTVAVGEKVKVRAVAQGIDEKLTYEYSSSDETVAVVKQDMVQGVSGGTAIITCTAKTQNDVAYTAQTKVKVIVPIKSLKADKSSVELGGIPIESSRSEIARSKYASLYVYKPMITYTPEDASNKTLEWSSSAPYIASVTKDGTIYGESFGTATITGKATDGSNKTVEIKVTVPECIVTTNEIVITSPEGAELGYAYTRMSGMNEYSSKAKGDCFTRERMDDDETGLHLIKILPLKAGSGSISFIRNGKTMASVKVKVEKSAVFDEDAYRKTSISKLIKNGVSEDRICVTCTVQKCDGDTVYAYTEEDDGRQFISFQYEDYRLVKKGDVLTVFGVVDSINTYKSETGLYYDCPHIATHKVTQ